MLDRFINDDPLAWVRFLGYQPESVELLGSDLTCYMDPRGPTVYRDPPVSAPNRLTLQSSFHAGTTSDSGDDLDEDDLDEDFDDDDSEIDDLDDADDAVDSLLDPKPGGEPVAAEASPEPHPAAHAEVQPPDPYSLDDLNEHLAIDVVTSMAHQDPVGFMSFLGFEGVTEAEIVKMPDVFEGSADHLIKLTKCAMPGSPADVPIDGETDKDWFIHVALVSDAAHADIANVVYQFMNAMFKYDMVGRPVVVALRPSPNGVELSGCLDAGSLKTWYQVIRLWDHTPEDVLLGSPVLYPFVALTNVTAEDLRSQIRGMRDLMTSLAHDLQSELWMRMRVLTGLLYSVAETDEYLKDVCSMPDLRESSTYREIIDIGRLEGKAELVLKLLQSRFPSLRPDGAPSKRLFEPDSIPERIVKLSADQLDELAVSFVFITGLPDLERWLAEREDKAKLDPRQWPR